MSFRIGAIGQGGSVGGGIPQVRSGFANANGHFLVPGGSAAPLATASATQFVYGAWVQLIASYAEATHLLGVMMTKMNNTLANYEWAVQVGVGAAGAEAPVAEALFLSDANGYTAQNIVNFGHPILIPANSRISVRMANFTNATNYAQPFRVMLAQRGALEVV